MPEVAAVQLKDMYQFRATATPEMKERYQRMIQTVWSDVNSFLDGFYNKKPDEKGGSNTAWNCFRTVFDNVK